MCPQGPTRLSLNAPRSPSRWPPPCWRRRRSRAPAEDDNVPIDTKILRSIMEGIGLKRAGEAQIKYQERAPLVIPPSTDLPPPQKPGAAIANNPAWPKDPDVARAKLLREREKNRDVSAEAERDENPLPPDQLAPGAARQRTASRGTNAPDNPSGNKNGDDVFRMTPSELGYHGGLFGNMFDKKDDTATRQIHRRAEAHLAHRAAARLSDAVAEPALRPRASRRTSRRRKTLTSPAARSNNSR